VLTSIENGDIMVYQPNAPLTQIANNSHDITALQSFAQQWKTLGNEQAGISESLMGLNPPSGTAWRQTQALLQESHSLFEIMTENKGLAIEKMLREYIIPHLKKKMDTTDEVVATLSEQGISEFDAKFIPSEAARLSNSIIKEQVLSGQIASQPDILALQEGVKQGMGSLGNTRYIKPSDIPSKTWKDIFKDFEWEVEVDITGESKDRQAVLETLSTVLQTIASNPLMLQDPNARMVFNAILDETAAISPLQLSAVAAQPPPPQPQPVASTPQRGQPQPFMGQAI
jgi:hypothetical protein